jgi:Xaa-Pro aminopeptidase
VDEGELVVGAGHLSRRRAAAAATWELTDELVLVGAGEPLPVPGRGDRMYPFRSHSEYFYLTDRERPGGVLAFDPAEGWLEFMTPVTREELLWAGTEDAREGLPDGVRDVAELPRWLEQRRGRRYGCLGSPVAGAPSDKSLEDELRYALNNVRRVKDDAELARMRKAEAATRSGFLLLGELIAEGQTERGIQVSLEAEFLRRGADFLAFDTIVAAGSHSAVLHFAPTEKVLAARELVLVDAGGEYRGYVSDVTRTYPVSGAFTPEQAELYAVVRAALAAATRACRPGVEWRDVHRIAAHVIADGLVATGILRGSAESLFEGGTVSLFFPHGIGHMVGLGIRDAGGALRDREPPGAGFPPLRVDLPLQAGYTMTVELGVYFVPALLRDSSTRAAHRDAVDWDRVDALLDFGGIRLEDDVLITDDGCEVLTTRVPLLDEAGRPTATLPEASTPVSAIG